MSVVLLQQQAGPRLLPMPTGVAYGADLSNHQTDQIAQLLDPSWEYVVLRSRAPGEPQDFRRITIAQSIQVRAAGMAWDAYDWGYLSADPVQTAADTAALMLAHGCHGIQHLDCETYTDRWGNVIDPGPTRAAWIRAWVREVRSYRLVPSIYSGIWWIREWFEGGEYAFSEFAEDCLLWLSNYNPLTWETLPMPYGWPRERLVGWQYSGSPLDLDRWSRRLLWESRLRAA